MERCVLHLDLVDFPVAVERRRDPALRDQPLVIALPNDRSRVLWASEEARSWGADRGMTLGVAKKLCRGVEVRPPDERVYAALLEEARRLLSRYSPAVEPEGWGRLFVDLSGTGRLFGPARDTAQKMSREIENGLDLDSRLGLSTNKSTSEVATAAAVDDLVDVFPGSEAAFLSPRKADLLPGVDEVSAELLDELNIRIIGQFARTSPSRLALVFGRLGPVLHLRANGCDPRPVNPPDEKPAIREEEVLAGDTNAEEELLAALFRLTERCAFRLRAASRAAGSLELQASYSDRVTVSGKNVIHPPSSADRPLFDVARFLFQHTVRRRVRVGYLRLSFGDLAAEAIQMPLFPKTDASWKEAALVRAMDEIRSRHGATAVRRGRGVRNAG